VINELGFALNVFMKQVLCVHNFANLHSNNTA